MRSKNQGVQARMVLPLTPYPSPLTGVKDVSFFNKTEEGSISGCRQSAGDTYVIASDTALSAMAWYRHK